MPEAHAPSLPASRRYFKFAGIVALAVLALAIHGYHYGIEDEAIYLPAIKKLIDPTLYPHDSQYFTGQARWTAFPWLIAGVKRVSHLPLPWLALFTHFGSLCLLLFGCSRIVAQCFPGFRGQAGGLVLFAISLTLPVAGTGLYLADQHLHPRTLANAFVLLAISAVLERRPWRAVLASTAGLVVHPFMVAFSLFFVVLLALPLKRINILFATTAGVFLGSPYQGAGWREALATRRYFSLRNWEWYEWIGLLAPFAVLWWLNELAMRRGLENVSRLMRALLLYAGVMCAVTLGISISTDTDFLWPLSPFRYLYIVYALMALVGGGLLGRLLLRGHAWRWAVLMGPLCAVMFFTQREQFASSGHIDIPGKPVNAYVRAFEWAKENTSRDAFFALDPEYMKAPREDSYGFRAIAERSQMPDISKDAAVVVVAPELGPEWKREVDGIRGWKMFGRGDFARLRKDFDVGWAVLETKEAEDAGLDCPYHQDGVAVCRTPVN
jgi:hypothetical protein